MHTIAIVNEKGGTGKTTTTVNLSAALGEAGKKVLLVDLDGQAASSRWLGVQEDSRFADALWRGTGLEPIAEVMRNVSLAPGHGKLDAVAHDLRPTQGGQLRKLLGEMTLFDYILIDCPPSLGNRLIGNALLAATQALVPVETSILALDGLKILLTTLDDIREGFGHAIELAGVVACRYDHRTRLSRMVLEELRRALPGKVFQTVIRENVRIRECPATGMSILGYAPDSHAAEDYRSLAREVIALDEARQAALEAGTVTAAAARDLNADYWKQIAPMLHKTAKKASPDEEDDAAAVEMPAPEAAAVDEQISAVAAEASPQAQVAAEPAASVPAEAPVAQPTQPQVSEAELEPDSQWDCPAATPQAGSGLHTALDEVIKRIREADLSPNTPAEPTPAAVEVAAQTSDDVVAAAPEAARPSVLDILTAPEVPAQAEASAPEVAVEVVAEAPAQPAPAGPTKPTEPSTPEAGGLIWAIDDSGGHKPEEATPENADNYPALQEMLKRLGHAGPDPGGQGDDGAKRPGWRRFLEKVSTTH
ncbi:MAG: AAA family ATPase [Phycisphaerae bacterium]|jgi:chromosome partitioning protein